MVESNKAKDTAKKKLTRNANPEESLGKSESGVESAGELQSKTSQNVAPAEDALYCGYSKVDLDVDPFDNERNFNRMRPELFGDILETKDVRAYNQKVASPGYGPKKKEIDRDQDGEDYGD